MQIETKDQSETLETKMRNTVQTRSRKLKFGLLDRVQRLTPIEKIV